MTYKKVQMQFADYPQETELFFSGSLKCNFCDFVLKQ